MADNRNPGIESRLADIERTQERVVVLLEALTKQVGDQAREDGAWRQRVDLLTHGDGNGNRGMLVRIDRLEQSAERARWTIRTLVGSVLALAGKTISGMLGH